MTPTAPRNSGEVLNTRSVNVGTSDVCLTVSWGVRAEERKATELKGPLPHVMSGSLVPAGPVPGEADLHRLLGQRPPPCCALQDKVTVHGPCCRSGSSNPPSWGQSISIHYLEFFSSHLSIYSVLYQYGPANMDFNMDPQIWISRCGL